MTTPDPPSPSSDPPVELDLSLFHVSYEPDPKNAEPSILPRETRWTGVKRRFWRQIAKRLDLSGANSTITHVPVPYRSVHQMEALASQWEEAEARFRERVQHWEPRKTSGETRQLNQPYETYTAMQEKTAQFFLRNVPRAERSADVWKLASVYAVWREEEGGYFEEIRYPRYQPPSLLDQWSTQWVLDAKREKFESLHGFKWADRPGDFRYNAQRVHNILMRPKERVSVNDLSLDPAPSNRPSMQQVHFQTMKALGKRYDGTQ